MNKNGLEIERKFLIEYPNIDFILNNKNAECLEITQCYLKTGGRVRKIVSDEKTVYIKTVKQRITDIIHKEEEWEISEEEYNKGIENKIPNTNLINKVRYTVPYQGFMLEIDVFPFWNDRAFLEIELESETQEIKIPDYIRVIKEVTSDKRYKNSSLSKQIITEELNI